MEGIRSFCNRWQLYAENVTPKRMKLLYEFQLDPQLEISWKPIKM
jgi:hypothetical protein